MGVIPAEHLSSPTHTFSELLQREQQTPGEAADSSCSSVTPRNDKRFFLKTQKKREVRFLLDNLQNYVEHLGNYPHSLLVKFLGTPPHTHTHTHTHTVLWSRSPGLYLELDLVSCI